VIYLLIGKREKKKTGKKNKWFSYDHSEKRRFFAEGKGNLGKGDVRKKSSVPKSRKKVGAVYQIGRRGGRSQSLGSRRSSFYYRRKRRQARHKRKPQGGRKKKIGNETSEEKKKKKKKTKFQGKKLGPVFYSLKGDQVQKMSIKKGKKKKSRKEANKLCGSKKRVRLTKGKAWGFSSQR